MEDIPEILFQEFYTSWPKQILSKKAKNGNNKR